MANSSSGLVHMMLRDLEETSTIDVKAIRLKLIIKENWEGMSALYAAADAYLDFTRAALDVQDEEIVKRVKLAMREDFVKILPNEMTADNLTKALQELFSDVGATKDQAIDIASQINNTHSKKNHVMTLPPSPFVVPMPMKLMRTQR